MLLALRRRAPARGSRTGRSIGAAASAQRPTFSRYPATALEPGAFLLEVSNAPRSNTAGRNAGERAAQLVGATLPQRPDVPPFSRYQLPPGAVTRPTPVAFSRYAVVSAQARALVRGLLALDGEIAPLRLPAPREPGQYGEAPQPQEAVGPPTGTAAWTEEGDTCAATGAHGVTGTSAWTEEGDTCAAVGVHGVAGSSAWTDGDDACVAVGVVGSSAVAAWTEQDDTCAAVGAVGAAGALAWTEASDVVAAVGAVGATGTTAVSEADDVAAAVGAVGAAGLSALTEAADILAAVGAVGDTSAAAWTEQDDTLAASGTASAPSGSATVAATSTPTMGSQLVAGGAFTAAVEIRNAAGELVEPDSVSFVARYGLSSDTVTTTFSTRCARASLGRYEAQMADMPAGQYDFTWTVVVGGVTYSAVGRGSVAAKYTRG